MNSAEIQKIDPNDSEKYLNKIAELHKLAFTQDHFSSLFEAKTLENYYSHLLSNSDLALVCIYGNKLIGFAVAGNRVSQGVRSFINQHRLQLFFKLIKHPKMLAFFVFRTFFNKFFKQRSSKAKYRLTSIAVAPDHQAMGIGRMLLKALEAELKNMGIDTYGLSVKSSNSSAMKFYERNGFETEIMEFQAKYLIKEIL